MERLKINFKGRVQGVGFRFHSLRIATDLNLTGSVKNLYDGSVEVYVQGRTENIEAFIRELDNQKFVRIESKDISKMDLKQNENSFEILY
ncbi:MAG: acylphosphatase [Anaerococcus sp.]|uniref:acylphosphatase n=1 Tax=Anaerococcus sp. TaxID=1872515 RepID=UPI0026366058|nr:acylphosphatase [Anaerococcus sp.]MCI5972183.1 acylphosphatase [Anaerococcus sp.]MDD6919020.1 acylphosphatase [Peptoniphilaceae bacterium]MDY2927364.1 acylphosphatase [Anaerococcus sp.]